VTSSTADFLCGDARCHGLTIPDILVDEEASGLPCLMMAHLRQYMLRSALLRVFARRCPMTIPRTGEEAERINCLVAYVDKDRAPYLLLDSLDGEIVKCRRWDGNAFSIQTDEPISRLVGSELRIFHYYGLDTIRFTGLGHFLRHRFLGLIYVSIHFRRAWHAASQFLFNKRSLRSHQRLRILRMLVSHRLAGNQDGLTYFDVMTELYSFRWTAHPAHEARSAEVELQLDSLVVSGDLEKHEITYRATPNSLITLERTDEEERRHREASALQLVIVLLTLIIAFAALVQAGLIKLPTLFSFG